MLGSPGVAGQCMQGRAVLINSCRAVLGSACRVVLVLHAASGLCRVVHVPGMFVQQQGRAVHAGQWLCCRL